MKLRSPQEIQEQLQARMSEMEAESKSPKVMWPCAQCRWADGSNCNQPLMKGYYPDKMFNYDSFPSHRNKLCGPEKVLWEAKDSWWDEWWQFAPALVVFGLIFGAGFVLGKWYG